uniref:Uncharacterized protein n=1 Tax=Anopheles epiroticus TaxID=199890 RepID=A0A182PU38_9DIPT
MDVKEERIPSVGIEVQCCRVCVIESEAKHCMDEIIVPEGSLSLNMMLQTMFPTFDFGENSKLIKQQQQQQQQHLFLSKKVCENCKHKVLVAYELYMLLAESEERLQQYLDEADLIKSEQSCAPYEVLIECSYNDDDTAFAVEEEQPVVEMVEVLSADEEAIPELEVLDEVTGKRRSGRKQRAEPTKTEAENKRTPSKKIKKERTDSGSGAEDGMDVIPEGGNDQLDESNVDEQIIKPVAKKRGRKPKIKTESTSESTNLPEVKKERKKRARTEAADGADGSSDPTGGELQSKVDVYQCQLCEGHTYGSPMELTVHLKKEHPDLIRTCDKCPKVFMTEAAYQHHQYCHATLRSYFCMFCDKGFQTENLLKSHTRSHTHLVEFLCSLCGKKFNNKSNLRQHLVRHSGVKPWACTQCPSRFCTKGALNLHQRTHSKLKPFSCDTCGSQFHTRYSLIKHQLIHTECRMHEPLHENGSQSLQIVLEKLFPGVFNEEQVQHDYTMNWPMVVCQECKRKENEEECAIDVQAQEFLECDLIPETEPEPETKPLTVTLQRSTNSHKSEPPAKVTRTKKGFTATEVTDIKNELAQLDEQNALTLQEDDEIEFDTVKIMDEPEWKPPKGRGRKPRTPKVKVEKVPQERKKRERKAKPKEQETESKTELYKCQLCSAGPTYDTPGELTEHLKTEHMHQIRPCDKCPKVFVSEQTFQHHQYCHATGRSFFCDFCDKGFQTEPLLTSHVKTHTRGPKFLCSYCGKGFTSKSSLQKHMTFHTDSKSWPCKLCPCRFNTKACLHVHMRTHTKTKIYTCPTCGSQFNKHYSMVKHQIIHTDDKDIRFTSTEILKLRYQKEMGQCSQNMDEEQSEELVSCCRICISTRNVEYCIHERVNQEASLSLQYMLEKLFPSAFNAVQVRHDGKMRWPSKICQECKRKVLVAYDLYAQCLVSADRLERMLSALKDGTTIREDINVNMIEEETAKMNDVPKENPLDGYRVPVTAHQEQEESNDKSHTEGHTSKRPRSQRKRTVADTALCTESQNVASEITRGKWRQTKTDHTSNSGTVESSEEYLSSGGLKLNEKHENGNHTLEIINIRDDDIGVQLQNESAQQETLTGVDKLEQRNDLYSCLLCDAPTYSSPDERTEHLKETHPDQIHSCKLCPKVFMTKAAFEHHQYCHATGRSHFCSFCDKGFQTEALLKNHVRTHTDPSDYLCSLCGKEFNHKNKLRQHMIGHTGQKPWACMLCPCRFSTKGGLTNHQNTHTKFKAFSCDTCGSQFNKHYSLIKHKLIHTGERPFGCEICKMRFVNNYLVKRHMRTHTGEKPFKCTYCERSFAQSNDMVKHMKTHVGSNPYQCDRCEASFRLLTDLRNHYKEHYQAGEHGAGSSAEEDKGMRFTSLDSSLVETSKSKRKQNPSVCCLFCLEFCHQTTSANAMEEEYLLSNLKHAICRICSIQSTDQYCMYEIIFKDGTLSMHMMLEKLVPSVFNAEQMKVDEYMGWPRKICEDCRVKVLEAYGLYEQCMMSGDLGKRMTTKQRVTHVTEPRTPTPTDDIQYLADESDEQTVNTRKSASKKVTRKTTTRRSTSSKSKSTSGGSGKVQRSTRTSARKATEKIKEESTNETDEPQTKIDLYRCLLCDAPTYTSPKEHTEHLKQEHPDQIHSCELCPKVFMTKAAYEHHQYCHATGRSFFCTFCDKGFQTEQLLKNHMRTHTHGTGFLCSHCGQEFSNRSNLRQHLIRHTGEKPWQCELCPSRFSMKSYLDRHMHTHTKAKFFSCDSCGSQFSRHYSLVKHQLIHTAIPTHATQSPAACTSNCPTMEKEKPEEELMTIQLTFCRICAVLSTEDHSIYEAVYKNGTQSIHAMMEKLVPSVFNAEQVKVDEFMSFPTKVCGGCEAKVLAAYALYEQCVKSGDLLRKCLARKKHATFVVNITGGEMDASEALSSVPLHVEEAHVGMLTSHKSQTTVVEIVTEEASSEDAHCKEEMANEEVMELVPVLDDDQEVGLENEDQDTERLPEEFETVKAKLKRERVSIKQQDDHLEKPEEGEVVVTKFRCLLCTDTTYSAPVDLTEHLKKIHPEQIYTCSQCSKVFMTKGVFEHHRYCHATGRSFFCTFCDKGFQTEQLLSNHVRTHTHGTGFLCSQCGKEFSDRSNLRQHEYRHTGNKPWACTMCPSRFSTKGYLTVHLNTHTKAKLHSCDTFTSAYHVKIHMRTHTGEKPYKCGYCGRGFAQKNDMLKHTKTHGKPYPCGRCDASFQQIEDLRVHVKEHDRAMKREEAGGSSAEQ